MTEDRRTLRVFVGSPSDLGEEREIVVEILSELNDVKAHALGYHLEPVGWENTLPGLGRPQERINVDLDRSDVAVMMLGRRWGSPTGEFSSGFAEEFERCQEMGKPVLLYFKEIEPAALEDPGPQLQRVVTFKSRVQEENAALFDQFNSNSELRVKLRRDLAKWIDEYEAGVVPGDMLVRPSAWLRSLARDSDRSRDLVEHLLAEPAERHRVATLLGEEAYHRARAGFIDRAVELYHASIGLYPLVEAMQGFQHLLISMNKGSEARRVSEKLLEIAERTGDSRTRVFALEGRGRAAEQAGDLETARDCYEEVATIGRQEGLHEALVTAEMHFGVISRVQGDFETARARLARAREIAEAHGTQGKVCEIMNHEAAVRLQQLDLEGVRDLSLEARELAADRGLTREVAIAEMHLAILCGHEEALDDALEWFDRSLKHARRAGDRDLEMMLVANRGNMSARAGDLEEARRRYEEAVELAEAAGQTQGLATALYNLGAVLVRLDRPSEGEVHLKRAANLFESLGDTKKAEMVIEGLRTPTE